MLSSAKELKQEGDYDYTNGNYDAAIRKYSLVLRLDPTIPNIYLHRGCARWKRGKRDEAISDYTKAIAADRYNAGAYYKRGYSYFQLKKLDEAIADLDTAISLIPDYGMYYYTLAKVYETKVNLSKAVLNFVRAHNACYYENDMHDFMFKLSKKQIFDAIQALPIEEQIPLLQQCSNKNTLIGDRFRIKGGPINLQIVNAYLNSLFRENSTKFLLLRHYELGSAPTLFGIPKDVTNIIEKKYTKIFCESLKR